ncbi:MAG: diaminopimelate epimerase [Leptolyngbya sp. PLA1]|nr:diaminopimelate epimerase [Leptolyngbya sp. PLA1]
MRIDFVKVHGLGNDLILVDAIDRPEVLAHSGWSALATAWCARHTGIGADGVLLLGPGRAGSDFSLRILNADGSEAGMCGNGMRCVARHLAEDRGVGDRWISIRTSSALVRARAIRSHEGYDTATVELGEPSTTPAHIPLLAPEAVRVEIPPGVRSDWAAWWSEAGADGTMTCVSVGNPHAVIFVRQVDSVPVDLAGPSLERHPLFPEGTNVHFMEPRAAGSARVRTWERGSGVTQACGSGACASVVAGVLRGVLSRDCAVELPGGSLRVNWDSDTGRVSMTGPAVVVFRGTARVGGV